MADEAVNSALLVIDVQQGLFERSAPIYRAEKVLDNINFLVEKAHQENIPVIYIQHANDTTLQKGTREWQFHPQIKPQQDDLHIHKQHGNAFEETELHTDLQKRNITRIIATGLVTHGCVKSTCLGGLDLDYQVVLASDAHSNFSNTAKQIIKQWHTKLAEAGTELLETSQIGF